MWEYRIEEVCGEEEEAGGGGRGLNVGWEELRIWGCIAMSVISGGF